MKRKTKVFAAIILTCSVTASLCACNLFGVSSDGSFPYDGAVSGGYAGTEAEYMAQQDTPSTRERQLYEEAVESGAFTGTYAQFLAQLNAASADDSKTVNQAFTSVVCVDAAFGSSHSRGAGVIFSLDKTSGDAYIVTNYHVIYSSRMSSSISVYLYGEYQKQAISAVYFGGAMDYDIAILKVTGSERIRTSSATEAAFGDSDSVTVGERVYALGNPNGEGFSATAGVVSVTAEYTYVRRADDNKTVTLPEIRTDAPVNHGNSGGGLFNARGELVGIVNARSEEDGVTGFGYALPVNLVKSLIGNILGNRGSVYKAVPGFEATIADSKGVYDETTGKYYIEEKLVVDSVSLGGLGSTAGLKRGDTLLSATLTTASGKSKTVQLTRQQMFDNLLFEIGSGDTLVISYSRSDEVKTATLKFTSSSNFQRIT